MNVVIFQRFRPRIRHRGEISCQERIRRIRGKWISLLNPIIQLIHFACTMIVPKWVCMLNLAWVTHDVGWMNHVSRIIKVSRRWNNQGFIITPMQLESFNNDRKEMQYVSCRIPIFLCSPHVSTFLEVRLTKRRGQKSNHCQWKGNNLSRCSKSGIPVSAVRVPNHPLVKIPRPHRENSRYTATERNYEWRFIKVPGDKSFYKRHSVTPAEVNLTKVTL